MVVRALEHHPESMEAAYAHVPGLQVVIPSTPYDTKGLLQEVIDTRTLSPLDRETIYLPNPPRIEAGIERTLDVEGGV